MPYRSPLLLRTAILLIVAPLVLAGCSTAGDPVEAFDGGATTIAPGSSGTDTGAPAATIPPDITLAAVNILTDFGDVCRGVKLTGATPYEPARAGVHPVVFEVGVHPTYDGAITMPDHWAPVTGEEHTVELVACLSRTSETLVQTCDGYQDDAGNDTGNTIEMFDATYDVRVLVATSGEELGAMQLTAESLECPMFHFFDSDTAVDQVYAEPSDALTAWMVALVET
jgi:hypothetical protein